MSLILNPYSTAGARTFTFIGSCTSTTSSLDFSALSAGTVTAGDLLVYIDGAQSGSAPTSVIPSAFTNGIDTAGSTFRGMVSGKKAAGGEGVITGMNGATSNSKAGWVFRPSTAFTSFSMLDTASEVAVGDPASQSCDPSAETTAAIVVGVADSFGGTGAFATFSPAADGTVTTSNNDMVAGYKIYNTSPQATTIDMADLGLNWLASLYFTVI